ncbi:unnamed protein product [Dibothriocephalus latus]|uniref:Uncharacterized protein n=1 Tax=Dibothriocephalus latus TaxID=60516 RepID=A0A3P7MDG3_DIBLA|nr:unnamed protein product [Dibothriocephalus latus]
MPLVVVVRWKTRRRRLHAFYDSLARQRHSWRWRL